MLGRAKLSSQKLSLIEHFDILEFILGSGVWGIKQKKRNVLFIIEPQDEFFFVLFPQASQPSMKFNISGLVYCVRREENAT